MSFSKEEIAEIRRAVMYCRDCAFLTTNDKNHEAVKHWESLAARIDEESTK